MRKNYSKLLLILCFMITVSLGWSLITDYSFDSSTGTYTEITGGTVHGTSANDNEVFNAIPIGFDFTYNTVVYQNVSIATNGFIAMGDAVLTSNTAISTGTSNAVIAPLNRDIRSRDDGELSTLMSGTAPNRVFTIQWKNYRRYPTAATNDTLNFQINLYETTNVVTFNYGYFYAANVFTAATVQCGLRGDSNAEFLNRTTTTDWTATTAGTANNATCRMNDTVVPPQGLIFTWTPPQAGTPPNPAIVVYPPDAETNVPIDAVLEWMSGGGGIPTGYRIYLGTDTPPTNLVNGTLTTETTYAHTTDYAYNTMYYWQIIPTNDFGDATGCPIWTFTTMPDPTVTNYPYTENWDAVTTPDVPPEWTVINANNDSYTWQTVNSGAYSTPNAMRCRFNSTMAMDDWFISPPLQLTNGTLYDLSFRFKAQNATLPEKLEVKLGTSLDPADMTNILYSNENVTNTAYELGTAVINPTTTGIYYVGWHGFSDMNMYYLFVDDITIDEMAPVFYPPTNLTAVGDADGINLSWTAPTPVLPNFVGYTIFKDGTALNTTVITTTTYTDTDFVYGETYTYYVVAEYVNPTGTSDPSNSVTAGAVESLDPVTDLQYTVALDNVSLTWTPPGGPILQDWIHYDDGTNYASIGTNSANNFDVAVRFTQTELSGVTDRYLTKVRYYPAEENCVYTLKIWTGGTSYTDPGTLALTLPITDPTINEWNEIELPSPIQVPSVGELWVGYNCDTQTGYPAGCDDGPSIPYKGNMIYFNNVWDILTNLSSTLDYNWNIQAFVVNYVGRETQLTHMAEPQPEISHPQVNPALFSARLNPEYIPATEPNRSLTGYKVYRDGVVITTITDYTVSNYTDTGLPNGTYIYEVTATYTSGESAPCDPVTATVFVPIIPTFFQDGFESYDDFALTFGNWMLTDVDQSETYGFTETDFPNEGSAMAYIIFNPSACTPPLTDVTAQEGSKMAACFAATTPPNNDWLITPRFHLGTENQVSFYAKSYTDQYGLERFRVGVSTAANPLPLTFVWLSGPTYVEATTEWVRYTYQVPASYNGQIVRYGIKCESNDAFIFLVDDFKAQGQNGSVVANEDEVVPVNVTALIGNYPNPFNPETKISFSVKDDADVSIEIYNLKGQKVKTLVNGKMKSGSHEITWKGDDDNGKSVASGVYFYRMNSGKYTSSKKMILMK